MSLGVDLVPFKTCSMDCIYCECGGTTNLTVERKEYVPTKVVLAELDEFLATDPELDFVTFSGAGEPTLHSGIGEIISFIKTKYPKYKTCLLTNASLLGDEQVIKEINGVDLVVPSLDAALEADFRKVTRAAKGITVESTINELVEFSANCHSAIWLEIFIVPGCNDSDKSVAAFREAVQRINPDKIQLNTLDRPGTIEWVTAPEQEIVDKFVDAMSDIAPLEVVGKFKYSTNAVYDNCSVDELADKVCSMISRRPCTALDISFALSMSEEKVDAALKKLLDDGALLVENEARGTFYRTKSE